MKSSSYFGFPCQKCIIDRLYKARVHCQITLGMVATKGYVMYCWKEALFVCLLACFLQATFVFIYF